jgi:hypothetical protein
LSIPDAPSAGVDAMGWGFVTLEASIIRAARLFGDPKF